MSLTVLRSSALGIEPRVRVEGDVLRAKTSWLLRALTLFSYARSLHVARGAKYLFLERRLFWFFTTTEVVPIARIRRLDYSFSSLTTSWGLTGQAFDRVESFSVDLILEGDERRTLFRFRGPGAVTTGWLGVMMGDGVVDLEGKQDESSRRFVELLQEFLGVPLGEPVPVLRDATGRAWQCAECARPGPPRRGRCLYCGGPLVAVDAARAAEG